MKTLLVSGSGTVPEALRELVRRGSTTFTEQAAAEVGQALPAVDRIVFWTATADQSVNALAERYARAEAAEGRDAVVFVAGDEAALPSSGAVPQNERYVWPRDEDRLRMAFLTGA